MASQINATADRLRLRTGLFSMALLFVSTATVCHASEEEPAIPIDDLLSEQARIRNKFVDTILRDRKTVIRQLVPIIDPAYSEKYSDETRCAAAYLLGELRAVEAVPALSKALANPPGPGDFTHISRYHVPVLTALVKIGRPAVPAMIKNVEMSDDRILRKNSLDALNRILGGKRRLMELLARLNSRATDRDVVRRTSQARSWSESHYNEDEEPLY